MTHDVRPVADAQTEPTSQADSPRPRWFAPAAIGAAALVGTAAIGLVGPTDSGVPVCASQTVLGVDCPLCGGLRCVSSFTRGDLLAAADHNVLLAAALPVVVVLWMVWMFRSLRDRPFKLPAIPGWLTVSILVLLVVFTLLRNIDGGPAIEWLASTRSS